MRISRRLGATTLRTRYSSTTYKKHVVPLPNGFNGTIILVFVFCFYPASGTGPWVVF